MVWRKARRNVSSTVTVKMRAATRSSLTQPLEQTFAQSLQEAIFKPQALDESVTQAILESIQIVEETSRLLTRETDGRSRARRQ